MLEFLKINDKYYIVQIRKVDNRPEDATTVQCSLFDLTRLWCETISVVDLIEREKKSDAIIQYTPEIVNETILARKADDFSISQGCEDSICGDLFLRLKYYVQSYPVTFTLRLNVASTEELAENVLLPTWRTLLLLYEENCALKDIIIKKDIEIEQYKVEGAVLKRSLVATNKFNERKFAESFPLSAAEEGLRIRELIKSKDRRGTLMNHLKIKSKDPAAESGSPIKNTTVGKTVVTPTRRSPGGRAKGLDAIYAKQRLPKPISVSSISLKRLQVDADDEEDKEGILDESQISINNSGLRNASGMVKVRKITKL